MTVDKKIIYSCYIADLPPNAYKLEVRNLLGGLNHDRSETLESCSSAKRNDSLIERRNEEPVECSCTYASK